MILAKPSAYHNIYSFFILADGPIHTEMDPFVWLESQAIYYIRR